MAELDRVRRWADALIALHLDPALWSFDFDNAKTRAGLCDYSRKRITVSRYLSSRYEDDEIHQILLHEIAHALAGNRAGHGPKWRAIAAGLGYEGARVHSGAIADDLAPWVGTCPAGHRHYRYRRPARPLSCGQCSRRFAARAPDRLAEARDLARRTAPRRCLGALTYSVTSISFQNAT